MGTPVYLCELTVCLRSFLCSCCHVSLRSHLISLMERRQVVRLSTLGHRTMISPFRRMSSAHIRHLYSLNYTLRVSKYLMRITSTHSPINVCIFKCYENRKQTKVCEIRSLHLNAETFASTVGKSNT